MARVLYQTSTPKNVLPKPALQKAELQKRKTPFSNTYLAPNGKFTVEVSGKPLNYKNRSGNLKSIDNMLLLKSSDGYEYENRANDFKVKFAQNNQSDKLVYLEIDPEHWIAFSPVEKFTQIGTAQDNVIYYKGIRQNVDLEYAIEGSTVKERIILSAYPGSNTFTFRLTQQGIRFDKEADGSIWALDSKSGKKLFYFRRPYAEDAKENVTYSTGIDIVTDASGSRLILTVDDAWLKSAAYPVVIDPAIEVTIELTDTNNIWDTYIASGYPTTNYYNNSYMHTGYLSGYNTIRSLTKFLYLPSLPPGAKITSAYLSLYMYLGSTGGTTVNIYRITNNWSVTGVNWNNQPAVDSTPVLQNFTSTPNTEWLMDISSVVRDWYTGSIPNYGLMLRASNEANPKISFYSSNAAGHPTPKLIINYEIDALGAESYFSFHGNVNVHNGNLVLTDTDVTLPGRGVPISIQRAYNLRSASTSPIGDRWTLNVYMKLSFSDGEIVQLTDSDETIKYFTKGPDGAYRSPAGVTDTLLYENSVYVLEEMPGIRYTFTGDGRLDKSQIPTAI